MTTPCRDEPGPSRQRQLGGHDWAAAGGWRARSGAPKRLQPAAPPHAPAASGPPLQPALANYQPNSNQLHPPPTHTQVEAALAYATSFHSKHMAAFSSAQGSYRAAIERAVHALLAAASPATYTALAANAGRRAIDAIATYADPDKAVAAASAVYDNVASRPPGALHAAPAACSACLRASFPTLRLLLALLRCWRPPSSHYPLQSWFDPSPPPTPIPRSLQGAAGRRPADHRGPGGLL